MSVFKVGDRVVVRGSEDVTFPLSLDLVGLRGTVVYVGQRVEGDVEVYDVELDETVYAEHDVLFFFGDELELSTEETL